MNETSLPDLTFEIVTYPPAGKKGRGRTVGTTRLTKSGKGYACTLDKGQALEGRFYLFPKAAKGGQTEAEPTWAWEEYGLE